jgi:5'-nucleotidase / UDP-sugar diphosphatase
VRQLHLLYVLGGGALRSPRLPPALLVLALLAAPAPAEDRPPAAPPVRLTIVHTNDLHGHVEHFAAVAQVAKQERARNPNTLFLDAGDCITGTAVSTVFEGTPVFDVMNAMGYDAGTIGNHEFDHGWEKVHGFRELARHPLVCANALDPDGKPFGDAPYVVLDCGGVRVGVVGLLTGGLAGATTEQATEGVRVETPIKAARRLVPEVRTKADLVVLLTHCGIEEDAALAGSVPGIDIVVGGHSHTSIPRELVIQPHGTRVVQAGCYGRRVGVVDLAFDRTAKAVTSFAFRVVEVEGKALPGDPAVQKAVDGWQEKVRSLEEVIGRADRDLGKKALRPLLERIFRDTAGADLGYQNAQGIRNVVRAGEIRALDVFSVLPFENTLVKVRVKGARLPEALQKELGAAFDPAKEYVIATDSFVGDHRDRYLGGKGGAVEDTGLKTRDVVLAWVRRHGGFVPKDPPRDE